MAINFDRLFTSLGLLCGGLNEVNAYRGTTLVDRRDDLATQFVTALSVYGDLVSPLNVSLSTAQQAEDTYVSSLSSVALDVLLAEVNADRPLTDSSKSTALAELRRQMLIASETLNDCPGTVTTVDVGTPAGDHAFVFNRREAATGLLSDFFVPDVYLVQCSADRSNGGTAYSESFTVIGKPADALPTDATYPSGTSLSTSVTALDPEATQGLVTNGGFDDFTANTPDSWTIASGTAGTQVFEKVNDDPRGTAATNKSLRLLGASATLVKLRQELTVTALTSYAAQFRLKKVADPGTDWAVSIRLVDGSGTAIAGPGAYSNVLSSAAATSVAASWANVVTGQFITPLTLPVSGVFLEIVFHQSGDLTTAPANSSEVYVDHVVVIADEPLYDGGPSLTVFSGVSQGVVGDTRTSTVALASGVPADFLIRGIDRLIGLASEEARIPTLSGGSETQPDSLVT